MAGTLGNLLFQPLSAAGSLAKSAVTGNVISQVGLGAIAGGVAASTSGHDFQSKMQAVGKGMLFGAALGVTTPIAARNILSGAKNFGNIKALAKGGLSLGQGAGKAALFAMEHPLLVGGAAAGTVGLSMWSGSPHQSPTMQGATMNVNYNQQAVAAAEMGQIGQGQLGDAASMGSEFQRANWMQQVGSVAANSKFGRMANSTYGLVQGMHSGRHS